LNAHLPNVGYMLKTEHPAFNTNRRSSQKRTSKQDDVSKSWWKQNRCHCEDHNARWIKTDSMASQWLIYLTL